MPKIYINYECSIFISLILIRSFYSLIVKCKVINLLINKQISITSITYSSFKSKLIVVSLKLNALYKNVKKSQKNF